MLFTPGQQVAQGDALLHLEDKHERLALRLAEVAVKEAKRQVDRLAKLAPSGAVPVARLETAEAELESARLRVEQARADLADRTLLAPFDGIIGMTETDKGDRVTEDSLIAILDDRSAIEIEFDLPEEYAARIEPGMAVELRPWSNREVSIEGRISATDSRIAAATRSLKVKARIDNPVNRIRPGMSYEVRMAFGQRHYPAVREVAVLWSREGAYLWRVAGERAEKVFVKILRRSEGKILVEGDLEIGDLIVVEGLQGLRDGQPVEVEPFDREPAERSSSEAAPAGQTAEAD